MADIIPLETARARGKNPAEEAYMHGAIPAEEASSHGSRASFHSVVSNPTHGDDRAGSPVRTLSRLGSRRPYYPRDVRNAPSAENSGIEEEIRNRNVPPWINVLYPFIIAMNTKGIHMAFGIFLFQYKQDLLKANSYFQVAWIGSIQMCCILISTPFVRALLKKTHHYRLCFIIGTIGLITALFTTSVCTTLLGFLLTQGLLLGVSTGIIYNAGVMYLDLHFGRWLGVNNTISSTGSSIGGTLFVVIAKYCIGGLQIQWALRIFGFISLATMLPLCLTPHRWMTPREKTELEGGRNRRLTFERFSEGNSFPVVLAGMLLAFAGLSYGFYFTVTFGYDVAQMTFSDAANLLILMNSCQFAGHVAADTMKDALNVPLIILIPAAFCASQVIFMQIGMVTRTGLYVFACFYGFYSAEIESIHVRAIFTQLGDAAYAEDVRPKINLRMNVSYGVMAAGAVIGPPIAGVLIDHHHDGDFLWAQLFSGFCLLFASVLLGISVVVHLDHRPHNWASFWRFATTPRL